MCKRQMWKKGVFSLLIAAMCFMAEPAGIYVSATEPEIAEEQPVDGMQAENPDDVETLEEEKTGTGTVVQEDPQPSTPQEPAKVTSDQKNAAKQNLQSYMQDLKKLYSLDDAGMERLMIVYNAAAADIDSNTERTEAALNDFVVTTKSAMENVAYVYINSKIEASDNNSSSDQSNIKVDNPDRIINDDDRADADADLLYYMQSLEVRYRLDEKMMENLHKVFDSAVYYIANTEMTVSELEAYVSSTKGSLESAAVANVTVTTSEFIQVGDNWSTPTVSYGQSVSIVLPIINFGTEELRDLIIEPATSTIVSEWPFVPDKTGYLQTEPYIPGNKTYEAAMQNRREFTFHFTARDDVMSGYYPLKFHVWYTKSGIRCEEPAEVTVYVRTVGRPGSGTIGGSGEESSGAKPRIIVTGFATNPAEVYAGDTFTLNIHVKNTSKELAVTNLLFDLQAAMEGEDKTNTYVAFLPTSGSSSIYMDKISPNTEAVIEIEMTAKADLAQKPYVLDVNMKYDAGSMFDLTDTASVSIPINQESRFDISTPEVVPEDITVGSQSNVMFSIYNTGKTTLYNVQVKLHADSVEETTAFVGNLTSGGTGNVDVMVTGASATMDDGTVNVDISYEDNAGNVTTETKTITLYVSEEFFDEYIPDDIMMDMGEGEMEEGSHKGQIIAIIVIALIVGAGVGIFAVVRLRKKKKEASLLADDLAAIDQDKNVYM
ncbi:MAG: hypothetical protein HDR27_07195 [Lachnospiraceae bacterium]|nr:hypothetical protein [Lachnospiraceae bacterium]